MNSENRICQNCKQPFVIEPEDFLFYEKIKVPPPSWCPDCRQRKRYAWRNECVLYRRNCDLCGKSTVTIYSPNKPFKVYCPPCWWSDTWSAFDYGRDFDFSRPFFEQFQELQLSVPRIALLSKNSVNSEYTNHADNNKNCYLSFGMFNSENIMYSTNVFSGRDSSDCYRMEYGNELMYECINTYRCYQCEYGMLLWDCANCLYCYDCKGCSNCFMSSNLRNKKYHILNVPYTKEEYAQKMKEYNLGSFSERAKLYESFLKLIKEKTVHRFAVIEKSNKVSGNMIFNSKNAYHAFDVEKMEDAKYATVALDAKDSMDSYHYGLTCELIYECHALLRCYDVMFTHLSYDNSHLRYCDTCHNCENLFGCVGIKQGKYSIFNKRYSEFEYMTLREKIIGHMRNSGEYGQFFPPSLSPFGYNETQGQVYMPFTKEEALRQGFKWEDRVSGMFGKETLKADAIPDAIADVLDSILSEALACGTCTKNYNIVRPELNFYRRENIPIPRICSDCRYGNRIALRPSRKLWHRKCMCAGKTSYESGVESQGYTYTNTATHFHGTEKCPNEFETSYAPDRPEIVYCERCYQAEVA